MRKTCNVSFANDHICYIILNVNRYYIAGDKAGTLEMFADNLPGLPDNIRYAQPSGYWVGMAAVRKPSFSMYDFMATRPWMRNAIAKVRKLCQEFSRLPCYFI